VSYPSDLDGLVLERDEKRGIATVTLDVPEKLNRVSMLARNQLAAIFDELGRDDAVRVVMLAGSGDKAFTAGGDIAGFLQAEPEVLTHLHHNVAAPERCPKPVIAKLHGFTFGVGLELALACDFRIAAADLVLGLPEITVGMIPGSGGTQRLARMIGVGRAKDIIMRGRRVRAEEAEHLGIVTEVVEVAELDATADALAEELLQLSPLSLAMAKRVLNRAYDGPLALGLELEGLAYGVLRSSDDFREGVEAFVEKRDPNFRGT
jgi:2-oxoglutaroyl-CoA hydrolase